MDRLTMDRLRTIAGRVRMEELGWTIEAGGPEGPLFIATPQHDNIVLVIGDAAGSLGYDVQSKRTRNTLDSVNMALIVGADVDGWTRAVRVCIADYLHTWKGSHSDPRRYGRKV